jgi:hypothetical protein
MPYSCGLDDRHRTVRDPAPAGTGSGTGGSLRYAILFGPWVAQVGLVRATSSFIRSPTYVHRYATTSRFATEIPNIPRLAAISRTLWASPPLRSSAAIISEGLCIRGIVAWATSPSRDFLARALLRPTRCHPDGRRRSAAHDIRATAA